MTKKSDAHITSVLREPKLKSCTSIIGIIRFNNTHIKISTGYKVAPNDWSNTKYRIKNKIGAENREDINVFLSDLEDFVKKMFFSFKKNKEEVTKEEVKFRVNEYLSPTLKNIQAKDSSFFSFIEEFIKNSPNRVNINSGKKIEYRTIQKYKTVLKVLKDFSEKIEKPIDFNDINLDFYFQFTAYLTNTKKFSTNNTGKYIQTVKTFLNEASAKGLNLKMDYKSRRFKVLHEDADNIYLTEKELAVIYEYDFSKKNRLEKVRDLFLVGAYTGLRFSDLLNLKPECIKNGYIKIEQLKTSDKVVIPCHPIVNEIVHKYEGLLPRSISNQKMNEYIKEICQIVGINECETKSITKGGKRIKENHPKYELVSTHTARRSFSTNMYKMGVPTITIMKITGHKTEKSFMKYIKLSKEEHAEIMQNYWLKDQTKLSELIM